MEIPINWWAILVTVIVSFLLGNLWYGPLFGTAWMKSAGMAKPDCMTPEIKKKMMMSMVSMAIGALLMNFVLVHTIVFGNAYFHIGGISGGLIAGFWNWLGFVAPVTIGSVLWENRPWKYWFITAGYYLVVLLINGAILSAWV